MAKVIVERRGAVLEIRLNRPELLNAVDREAIAALGAAAAEAAEDRAARVVLFSGEGTHFLAPAATSRCLANWCGSRPRSGAR